MKNLISINLEIPTLSKFNSFFNSRISLDESDIVVFKTFDSYLGESSQYMGKSSYDENSSTQIKEDTLYWQNELKSFIESGKNVFIITSEFKDFYIKSGKFDYSGTGRNARRTDYVDKFHNYKFLNNPAINLTNANGDKFKVNDSLLNNFIKDFESILNFKCYIKSNEIKPLLCTKNGREIVSGILNIGKGNIIFLPNVNFDIEACTEVKNGKQFWNDNGLKLGKRFINSIVELDKSISSSQEKSIKPEWLFTKSYELKIENELLTKIELNKRKIEKLQLEIENLNLKVENEILIKDLLFETGKPLENSVLKSLKILGYKAENYDNGKLELDAVIISPEGMRFIGECEGKESKDIDISKFRQLNDSLAEDFEREEIEEKAKGLIFSNPQRLLNIADRKLDFTLKCKNAGEREKIGLIKTSDLFFVVRYLLNQENEEFKIQCRNAISEQLGGIIKFPAIPN